MNPSPPQTPPLPTNHTTYGLDFRDYSSFPDPHDFHTFPIIVGHGETSIGMKRCQSSESDAIVTDDASVKRARVSDIEEAGVDVRLDDLNGDVFGYGFVLNYDSVDCLGVGHSVRDHDSEPQLHLGGLSAPVVESVVRNYLDEEKICETAMKGDNNIGADLNLRMMEVELSGQGSSSSSSQKRSSRDEKGKGVLESEWLPIAIENHRMAHLERGENTDGDGERGIYMINNERWKEALGVINKQCGDCVLPFVDGIHYCELEESFNNVEENGDHLHPQLNLELEATKNGTEPPPVVLPDSILSEAMMQARRRRNERRITKMIAKDYAYREARPQRVGTVESPKHEIQEITGPFSVAMRKILDYKEGKHRPTNQQSSFSIDWMPTRKQGCKLMTSNIPSLLDLSLSVLTKNADSIVSLEPLPDALKHRIIRAACDHRKMDIHLLEMFVSDSPTEVYVKDCSWMTEEQLIFICGVFNTKNLLVLQLDLCGQALTEYMLRTTLAKSKNSLPALANLSLKAACRLTDDGLASIVESAPSLQSINLSQCSLLTSRGIRILASCLGSMLKELYLDDCQSIEALDMLPAVASLEHLEVLSVSGIHTISDEFVCQFIISRGSKLKEIGLANCQKLTDNSLKAIGTACPGLCSLDVSNLDRLTDATLEYIANGCRSIQSLKFCRNSLSDEAVASFLEASGQALNELSLNHIRNVGCFTALSLAKHSRGLQNLDLSWCRMMTDAAVGLIVDSCLSLRLLKLFGCTQISEVFLNGHSNPNVEIIGLNNMPLLKELSAVDTHPGPLRYSPLIPSERT